MTMDKAQKASSKNARTLEILSALAEPTRLAAVGLVWSGKELCLCEIMKALDVSQSRASRHMAVLTKAGILQDRRDAQWVRYKKNPELSKEWKRLVDGVLAAAGTKTEKNRKA